MGLIDWLVFVLSFAFVVSDGIWDSITGFRSKLTGNALPADLGWSEPGPTGFTNIVPNAKMAVPSVSFPDAFGSRNTCFVPKRMSHFLDHWR